MQYSFNNNTSNSTEATMVTLSHIFVSNCGKISWIQVTLWFLSACMLTVLCYWYYQTFYKHKDYVQPLQRVLTSLFTLKYFDTLLYCVQLTGCPWYDSSEKYLTYVDILRFTISTVYFTALFGIFYVLGNGWQIVVQQLNRDQGSNLVIVMGMVYIAYSA